MENILTKKVILEPEYINNDYKTVILNKLKNKYNDTCDKDNGYILEVINIIDCKEECLSRSTNYPEFTVRFTISNFLPKINNVYSSVINMLSDNYIMCCFNNKMIVFIDKNSLSKTHTYNKLGICWVNINTDKILRLNDNVEIKIIEIQYRDKKFICIGEINV